MTKFGQDVTLILDRTPGRDTASQTIALEKGFFILKAKVW